MIKQEFGKPFSVTSSGTSTATAQLAGVANSLYYITDVQASSAASQGTFAVYGGATGTTVLWQGQLGNVPYIHSWNSPLQGTMGAAVSITANGTTATYANISGFILQTSAN